MKLSSQLLSLHPPAQLGHLATKVKANIPIVRRTDNSTFETHVKPEKYHPLTAQGRSPNPGMIQIPAGLSQQINQFTLDWSPQEIRQRVANMYFSLQQGKAHGPALEKLDADAQIIGLFLQTYVSVCNALREIKKRRPGFTPRHIMDIGFGPAIGLLAVREVFGSDIADEEVKQTAVIIGHPHMKQRAKELLGEAKGVQFRNDVPSTGSALRFDLVIATHQLYQHGQLTEALVDSHSQKVGELLNKDGLVLFLERGDPLGFESVALARECLTRPKFGFNVVAPCVHNLKCPLQVGLEARQWSTHPAQENWCRFTQNVDRPKFTRELKKGQYLSQQWLPNSMKGVGGSSLKGKGRPGSNNNEVANFSWVALEYTNGESYTQSEWPRILKQPLKRSGHATMEVCAPSGNIEHWTIPRSQGKQAYHDVRKANASDLWALDAKVKQVRGGLRDPEGLADSKFKIAPPSTEKPDPTVKIAPEWLMNTCKDWWLSSSNPFFKHKTHQSRILSENMVDPEDSSFVTAMGAPAVNEARLKKLKSREMRKLYRK